MSIHVPTLMMTPVLFLNVFININEIAAFLRTAYLPVQWLTEQYLGEAARRKLTVFSMESKEAKPDVAYSSSRALSAPWLRL